jgi:hypothetical protein
MTAYETRRTAGFRRAVLLRIYLGLSGIGTYDLCSSGRYVQIVRFGNIVQLLS